MGKSAPKVDRRLLGTWKSDRRRTFTHYKPKRGCPPSVLRWLKGMFGKLVVRWTRRKSWTDLNGYQESCRYEVVATDSETVVIRYQNGVLEHIHFDGDFYWIACRGGGMCEFFRRVAGKDGRKRNRGPK